MFFSRRKNKTRKSRSAAPVRRFVRRLPLYLERLENRILLSADNWTAGSGNWDNGSNWSLGHAPGTGDTAIINTTSPATITIQGNDNIQVQNVTTGSNDTLSFTGTGGSLTVTSGTSTLRGALSMIGGSLTAAGAGVSLMANGSTTISAASLYAEGGATLSLPQMTSYTADDSTFGAHGSGSVLDVSALTTAILLGNNDNWYIGATNGGTLKLTGLTSIGNSSTGTVSIIDTGGSKLLLNSNITRLDGVDVTLDGTDKQVANSWTKLTNGYLTIRGGSCDLAGLTDIDGSSLEAYNGGILALPGLTSYAANGAKFWAEGMGSVLDVSALTTVTVQGGSPDYWYINATNGGTLKLTGLTSIGNSSTGTVSITGTGGSKLLLNSNITTLDGVDVTLDGADAQIASSWTKLTQGSLTITSGSVSLDGLTDVDYSSLYVSNGGSLALPGLTSYAAKDTTFSADGAGSVLDVSALTTTTLQNIYPVLSIDATNGGTLKLTGLTSIGNGGENSVNLTDTGGSTLLDSNLTTLDGVAPTLDGTDKQVANSWTKLTNGYLTITGGSYDLARLTDIDGSSLEVYNGGSLALPGLTSYAANGTQFWALMGGMLDVSALTTVTVQGGSPDYWSIKATNGGTLKLTGLTSLGNSSKGTVSIIDTNSTLLDGNLTTLDGVQAFLDGTDRQVAKAWTKFTNGTLSVTGGSISFPSLTDLANSNLSLSGGATASFPVLTTGNITIPNGMSVTIQATVVSVPAAGTSGATINVPSSQGFTFTLQSSGTLTDTTINVGQGSNVVLAGGTYLGTTTCNVGQGATVDLTNGQTTTYGGTLTGSGLGTVLFSSGILYPAVGGVTLNFPGSMFQWTGGGIKASVGDVTNQGTINLAGSKDKQIYADGTLFNYGTIIQTGSGNFDLHSDNVSPDTLNNEAGGLYLLESDSGISNSGLGDNVLINSGTIRKTAGTSKTTLLIPSQGYISNTGTIEADVGTLLLNANTINQVASNTLTAGTWNALNGATLEFPSATIITTNQANVKLDGGGANIAALASLNTNSGSLTLINGANFTTAGDITNSGSLTVGTGSTLTVSGNSTQTSTGALNDQFGGRSGNGQFGSVSVKDAANVAGTFNVSLVNGVTPNKGAVYPVMTFASASGTFGTVTGLSPYFTEQLNSTSLDLVNGTGTPVALQLSQVTAPKTATTGQQISVNWQVSNTGSTAATGSWQDSVYLSTSPTITGGSVLLGSVTHSGGLAAGGSYNASLTAAVPALPPGNYYVLVQTDSLDQVPVINRANNILAASTGQLAVSVPALTLGTPAQGTFTSANQDQYYQVTVPAGGSLQVTLTSAASAGTLALYVSQGTLPTPYNYQEASNFAGQPNQSLNVPVSAAGTYYILVHSVSGAAATAGYTLTATQTSALSVSAISPYSGGNAGNVTIEIDGANFTPQTTASLTLGTTTIQATATNFANASQLFATFNLSGAAVGNYTVSVQQGAQSASAATPFQVVAANTTPLSVTLSVPQYVRSGRTGTIVITYTNESNNDIVAPLLIIATTHANVLFSTPDDPNNFVQQAQVLAVASTGPAGILRPGQSGQLTLTLLSDDTNDGDQIPVTVSQIEVGQTIDWASQEIALKPSTITTAAWNVIWNNLMATVGTTTDSYNAALAHAAAYLGGIGETTAQVSDLGHLWSFLASQANASFPTPTLTSAVDASLPSPGSLSLAIDRTFVSSIASRYQSGIFGLGWLTSWQISLNVDSSGNVTINSGGSVLTFVAQPNGTYLDTDGEYGTLAQTGGVFTFTDPSGTQYVFLANGNLNYQQDTIGNRITLGYNASNQLVSLTYSNPSDSSEPTEQLTLTYNAQGLVNQVADGTGNTWTYSYDTAGHLLSVTAPGNLTTSYTYDTGTNPETANAMLSITNPDGSQVNFTYDPATGRLTGTSQNGGANAIAYTYPGEAEITATDAAGNKSTVWFNELGLPARLEDPLSSISTFSYDTSGNLKSYTDAAGNTYQYTYDTNGNLTQAVNPLGQIVRMTYGPLDNPTSITDAAGNTTQYQYNTAGNLLSITYPDSTQQSFSYDPLGNLSETVLQNGDPIGYQYNAQGLVTKQSFADGTSQTFTYDTHGNLLTADNYGASGNLTGKTTLTYNAANELLSITYPGGQSLTFTYNALGQRIKSEDQSGYAINYAYDSLGRLTKLTDGSNNLIVQYTYNNLGQLQKKANGNGTYTTFSYDANGNLTNEVNYADSSGKTVNSSFTYTYNSLNEQTSVTDSAGNITKYGYDAIGQLTQVTLPNGTSITYVYNAAGDRTEVLTNGTATNYSSNADNEITQVGSRTYTYDQNGNLHTMTDASGTTTYTYNDLNQLVSITNPDGSVQSFQYSPLGFMVGTSTTSGGTTSQTNYLVDPTGLGNVVAAYNGNGSLIDHYNYGLGLVSQTDPSGTGYYYDFDASGNTVGITGSSGAYVNQYSYLPFGETTTISATLPNPFTFAGQLGVMQIGTNQFYMRARDYTPATGQFLSNDPIGLAGGDPNVRRYVVNSPTNLIDMSGLQPNNPNPIIITGQQWNDQDQVMQNTLNESYPGYWSYYTTARTFDSQWGLNGSQQTYNITGGPLAGHTMKGYELNYYWQGKIAAYDGLSPEQMFAIIFGWKLKNYHEIPSRNTLLAAFRGYIDELALLLNLTSHDPNALDGPAGYGAKGFIQDSGTLPYTVDFENDGNAAAQDVTITEQLDPNLDWSTFQLGSFGFGSVKVNVPAGLTQYQTTIPYENTDGSSLDVKISLNFDVQTGLMTITFASIDPLTGQAPTGVFDGFLPPDNSSGIGEGFVQYTVQPKSGLASGTTISGQASVVFDTNATIQTKTVTNTIDATPPTSSVNPLPATVNSPSFTVSWSGSDPNSPGIASYNIYVSDNGGAFTPWLTNTTQTSATYTGQVGHHYGFYSVATDPLGLTQPTPSGAQATTYVWVPPPSPPAPPPSPPPTPPTLLVPPLLAFIDSLLGGIETINGNGTETITDSFFGIPLFVSTFDGSGNLVSVDLFGIDVTLLFG